MAKPFRMFGLPGQGKALQIASRLAVEGSMKRKRGHPSPSSLRRTGLLGLTVPESSAHHGEEGVGTSVWSMAVGACSSHLGG